MHDARCTSCAPAPMLKPARPRRSPAMTLPAMTLSAPLVGKSGLGDATPPRPSSPCSLTLMRSRALAPVRIGEVVHETRFMCSALAPGAPPETAEELGDKTRAEDSDEGWRAAWTLGSCDRDQNHLGPLRRRIGGQRLDVSRHSTLDQCEATEARHGIRVTTRPRGTRRGSRSSARPEGRCPERAPAHGAGGRRPRRPHGEARASSAGAPSLMASYCLGRS